MKIADEIRNIKKTLTDLFNLLANTNTSIGNGGISQETDPTVPDYVKTITQEDIDAIRNLDTNYLKAKGYQSASENNISKDLFFGNYNPNTTSPINVESYKSSIGLQGYLFEQGINGVTDDRHSSIEISRDLFLYRKDGNYGDTGDTSTYLYNYADHKNIIQKIGHLNDGDARREGRLTMDRYGNITLNSETISDTMGVSYVNLNMNTSLGVFNVSTMRNGINFSSITLNSEGLQVIGLKDATGDATFNKEIVANNVGIFGIRDKVVDKFIPLTGTEVDKPITGNIELDNSTNIMFHSKYYGAYLMFSEDGTVEINQTNGSNVHINGLNISARDSSGNGIEGNAYYGDNYSDKSFVQKKYVDSLIQIELDTKVDKIAGKGLSTNDYTTAEKNKLAGLDGNKFFGKFADETALNALVGVIGAYAYVGGVGRNDESYIWDDDDNKWVKSNNIPTAETPASVKTKYESNPDTNAFTNARRDKLNNAVVASDLPTANVGSATKLQTARTFTLGNTSKTFDGSANVAWTLAEIGAQAALTNPITGTATSGQVAFFNGTTTQTGDNGLFWNNTNKRLGIGTNTPSTSLDVLGALTLRKTSENEQTILTINRFNSFPMYKLDISGLHENELFLRNPNNQNIITFQRSGGVVVQGSLYSNTELGIGRSIGGYLSKFLSTDAYGSFYELQTIIDGVGWGSLLQWDRNRTYFNILSKNVGIGTTSPAEKLDVNGRIRAKALVLDVNSETLPNQIVTDGTRFSGTSSGGTKRGLMYNDYDDVHALFSGMTDPQKQQIRNDLRLASEKFSTGTPRIDVLLLPFIDNTKNFIQYTTLVGINLFVDNVTPNAYIKIKRMKDINGVNLPTPEVYDVDNFTVLQNFPNNLNFGINWSTKPEGYYQVFVTHNGMTNASSPELIVKAGLTYRQFTGLANWQKSSGGDSSVSDTLISSGTQSTLYYSDNLITTTEVNSGFMVSFSLNNNLTNYGASFVGFWRCGLIGNGDEVFYGVQYYDVGGNGMLSNTISAVRNGTFHIAYYNGVVYVISEGNGQTYQQFNSTYNLYPKRFIFQLSFGGQGSMSMQLLGKILLS